MLVKSSDNRQALKQLWGEFVPALTPEQVELATKMWQKIKARKQRGQKLEILKGCFERTLIKWLGKSLSHMRAVDTSRSM